MTLSGRDCLLTVVGVLGDFIAWFGKQWKCRAGYQGLSWELLVTLITFVCGFLQNDQFVLSVSVSVCLAVRQGWVGYNAPEYVLYAKIW